MTQAFVVHPTGNEFCKALLRGLVRSNMLGTFVTSLAWRADSQLNSLMPNRLRKELCRRWFPDVPRQCIACFPKLELGRLLLPKLGLQRFSDSDYARFSALNVYEYIDQRAAKLLLQNNTPVDAVYAYEGAALHVFQAAAARGATKYYDLPIAHWHVMQQLLSEEMVRYPEWQATVDQHRPNSARIIERKNRELELSDVIVTPSKFVADSLPLSITSNKRVLNVPFGSPVVTDIGEINQPSSQSRNRSPLRVLFAGSMGQRKGLADLFEAFKGLNLKHVELIVMGSPLAPMEFYRKQFADFTYERTRPHAEVLKLMRSCDVFCLPSIVEGRALVMQEAMSQGLPLIITPNTGGEDLIDEGQTGFLIPIRAPEAIRARIQWCIENRDRLADLSINARLKVKNCTWETYSATIVQDMSYCGNLNTPESLPA